MNEYRKCKWCSTEFGLTPKNQWAEYCLKCYFLRKDMKANGQYDDKDYPGDRYNQRSYDSNKTTQSTS